MKNKTLLIFTILMLGLNLQAEAQESSLDQDPSYRIGVFYYPWYETPKNDGAWGHWENETKYQPPQDISSDYYPLIGPYSSTDRKVITQHFKWLRKAGVGVIICSWWGQGDYTDQAIPILLDEANKNKINVTILLEPYSHRNKDQLLSDVKYILRRYAAHPAFFLTTAQTRWQKNTTPKPLLFLWGISEKEMNEKGDDNHTEYWQKTMDTIHALPQKPMILRDITDNQHFYQGHFDGLYNFATLDENPDFSWANDLPQDALYVASVIPGFFVRRNIGPGEKPTILPRRDGKTYENQWRAVLDNNVEPNMVTIYSFNEWHEGAQIEPAKRNANNNRGFTYESYDPLLSEDYLTLTRKWVEEFLSKWSISKKVIIDNLKTIETRTNAITLEWTLKKPSTIPPKGNLYYVNPSDSNASDQNDGRTSTFLNGNQGPWRTIQMALETMSAGDKTYIRAGIYHERDLLMTQSGTKDAPIELSAFPTGVTFEEVVIEGSSKEGPGLIISNASYITIRGLKFRKLSDYGIHIEMSHHINISQSTFEHNIRAINIFSSNYCLLTQNIAHHHTDGCFVLEENSSNNTVSNNTAYENFPDGFTLISSSNNSLINNLSHHNSKRGYQLTAYSINNTLKNNEAHHNNILGFALYDNADKNVLDQNKSHHNRFHGYVELHTANENTFINNVAYENQKSGFYFEESFRNTLTNNTSYLNERDGFTLFSGTNNNTFTKNTAHSNLGRGFLSSLESTNNIYSDNNVYDNTLKGYDSIEVTEKIFKDYTKTD